MFRASSFLLTGMLLVDDLYMVHDLIGPRYLGIPELAVLATLGVAGLTWLGINLPRLLRDPDLPILLLACLFFGTRWSSTSSTSSCRRDPSARRAASWSAFCAGLPSTGASPCAR